VVVDRRWPRSAIGLQLNAADRPLAGHEGALRGAALGVLAVADVVASQGLRAAGGDAEVHRGRKRGARVEVRGDGDGGAGVDELEVVQIDGDSFEGFLGLAGGG